MVELFYFIGNFFEITYKVKNAPLRMRTRAKGIYCFRQSRSARAYRKRYALFMQISICIK